jgi:hypothetical protein
MTLSLSSMNHIDGKMINECGTVCGIKIGRGTKVLRENLGHCSGKLIANCMSYGTTQFYLTALHSYSSS